MVGVPPEMAVLTCFPLTERCRENGLQDVGRRRGVVSAVWMRLRSELQARWRSWLGLALLIGLAGAAAAAAGARRTETAYPRFVQAQNGYDLITGGFPGNIDLRQSTPSPGSVRPACGKADHGACGEAIPCLRNRSPIPRG